MISPPYVSPRPRPNSLPERLTPSELRAIGLARYGTTRFVATMSRDTGIPLRTLYRYAELGTDKKLAVEKIRGLMAEAAR